MVQFPSVTISHQFPITTYIIGDCLFIDDYAILDQCYVAFLIANIVLPVSSAPISIDPLEYVPNVAFQYNV